MALSVQIFITNGLAYFIPKPINGLSIQNDIQTPVLIRCRCYVVDQASECQLNLWF
jgi:hypothetical protein